MPPSARWEIVGGADKGGILVRQGRDLSSPQADGRLSTGATVEELQLAGERLHYRRLSGSGPTVGWISIALPGKELARRLADPADSGAATKTPTGVTAAAPPPDGGELAEQEGDPPEWAGLKPPKRRGRFIKEGTGRPRLKPWVPKMPELSPKLQRVFPQKELLAPKTKEELGAEFMKGEKIIGYHHDMEFPFTLQMIQDWGADWLTKALHAAGTMPKDNKVIKAEAREFVGGGACLKAVIEVEYAIPSEDLHERLFCKYPFFPLPESFMQYWMWACSTDNDGPEIDFARLLSAGAPMRCPKYYFGDICPRTGLSLLITECFRFPEEDADFGPMELEPIPHKSVDYLLDNPFNYYDAIMRNAAKLAAWGNTGKLGKDVLKKFPPTGSPMIFPMGVKMKIPKYLRFVREVAPQLFPPNYADDEMEKSLYETLLDIEGCQKEIFEYLSENDKRLVGLTHQNMNIDNAFFWRDEEGHVQSGFIDWGRFRQDHYATAIMNGLSCCDLTDWLQEADRLLIQSFCDEYAKEHKPGVVVFEKLWEHYMVNWCLQSCFLVNLADHGIYPSWHHTHPEGWKTIKDYKDPRVYHMPNCNCGWVAMLRQFTIAWKAKDIPRWWASWRAKNIKTLTPKAKAEAQAQAKAKKAAGR